MSTKDITGQTQGRLTALRDTGRRTKGGESIWVFRCACDGKTIEVLRANFLSGNSQSCGCWNREKASQQCGENSPHFKHGHACHNGLRKPSPTYVSWVAMIQRCTNPKTIGHRHYADAGVQVCDRWLNSFEAFLEDLGERPEGTTLGRFGDVGNYSCGHCEQCLANGWKLNCSWQTPKQQGAEKRIHHQLQLQAA